MQLNACQGGPGLVVLDKAAAILGVEANFGLQIASNQ
jgi:hypothetical protein